jgi:D-glycero-D-manno-heptose 1,7-bisphosphate phosphatase
MSCLAVFLDRDGTLNEEVEYLSEPGQIRWLSGTLEALRELKQAGFKLVVVTNQAGIARGYFTERRLHEIHETMARELAGAGAKIDAFYFCPHHPAEGLGDYRRDCDCRKPRPGLLERAARELKLDLASSFMVGDKRIDLEAGRAAGCRSILVRTGYGAQFEQTAGPQGLPADFIADDILDAAQWILRQAR